MFRKPHFILFAACVFLMIFGGVSAQSTQPPRLLAETKVSETINDMDWSDANQLLAVGTDDGVYLYTTDLQQVTYFSAYGSSPVIHLRWKPDGTQLVTVGLRDFHPIVWDYNRQNQQISEARSLYSKEYRYLWVQNVAWKPDGTQLAAMRLYNAPQEVIDLIHGTIDIFNTNTWEVSSRLGYRPGIDIILPADSLVWHPTMNSIAYGDDYCVEEKCLFPNFWPPSVYVADTVSGESQEWGYDEDNIYELKWSPDGTRLAVAGSDLILYDATSEHKFTKLETNPNTGFLLNWSSDSKSILNITSFYEIRIHDVNQVSAVYKSAPLPISGWLKASYWLDEDQKLFLGTDSGDLSVWNTDFECADC